MAVRLGALLPRLAIVAVFLLGGTASLAFATQQKLAASHAARQAPAPAAQQTLRVPDVRGQAYVFAKGILEDAGFAWRVSGAVQGFATNLVAVQSPAPGAKVVDTGAPLVTLTLVRNQKYQQHGAPEDAAPYDGTSVLVTSGSAGAPATSTEAAPTETTVPATTTGTTTAPTTTASDVTPNPAPGKKVALEVAPKSSAKHPAAKKSAYPQQRPPAFAVPGASKEPLREMPLPDRARLLDRWLDAHRKPTDANVRHWLYQHAWIVTGARFGWWRGAEALRVLIADDRRIESVWGVGKQSELAARRALAAVEARSK